MDASQLSPIWFAYLAQPDENLTRRVKPPEYYARGGPAACGKFTLAEERSSSSPKDRRSVNRECRCRNRHRAISISEQIQNDGELALTNT
jgi:hypothetical protein